MRSILAAAMAALLASAGAQGAIAQPRDPAPATAQATERPSPEALRMAREMMVAMQIDEQMELVLQGIFRPIVEAESSRYNLSSSQREAYTAAAMDGMRAVMPEFMDRMAVVYARTFSIEEMRAIRDFHLSPAGRAMVERTPQLSQAGQDEMRTLMPRLMEEIEASLCRRVDCRTMRGPNVS